MNRHQLSLQLLNLNNFVLFLDTKNWIYRQSCNELGVEKSSNTTLRDNNRADFVVNNFSNSCNNLLVKPICLQSN